MKSKFLKSTLTSVFLLLITIRLFAQGIPVPQDPKYGPDSTTRVHCAMNISLYTEFYKQKNYKDAVKPWRKVYNNCPDASKNTFMRGATIYKHLIVAEKDANKKQALIDTLMDIYDQRIVHFGDKGTVLSYKGADLYSFRGESANAEVYQILGEAMKLEGKESKAAVVSIYMQTAVGLYKDQKLEGEKIIEAYTFCTETLDAATEYNKMLVSKGGKYQEYGEKELENIKISYDNVEALFSESGAASCDALISIFSAKYDENAQNLDWLKKINNLLGKNDCKDGDLFAKTAEQEYKLEPSAEAALNLARLFMSREEFEKADQYYEEAAKSETDPTTQAQYYYEWSMLAYAQKDYPKVRTLSNKALELNPSDGKPYLMIGKAYAATKGEGVGKEDVEKNSVYWIAVDNFVKAKQVDATLTDEANKLIELYSKYYPKKEDWFMAIGTSEGDSYTVGSWMNVSTKVRF